MSFCKTPAITLRRINYKDSSQIITFYTRDYGKIQTLAKGLKRSTRGISGGIDLLTYNNIVFVHKERSNLYVLTEWVLQDNFNSLRENLKKYYSASYILELVREFTEENDKSECLFNLFINTLYDIASKDDSTVSTLSFEVQMLALVGYLPEMNHCVICKAKMNSKRFAFFSASEGGLLCTGCGGNTRELVQVSGGAIATINYLASKTTQKIERLTIQLSLKDEIRSLFKHYISFLLNKELKMWNYL
ncbi:MAG: DNA repair protein RecO [Candidatus Scalinduaceae bacterium]